MNIAILNTPVYDYLTASLIEGLNELGHDVRTSEKSNYGNYLCKNEFIKFANNADIFIIGSNNYIKYEYLKDKNISIHPNGNLEVKPWGQKEFSLLDPDNNLLTFGEAI